MIEGVDWCDLCLPFQERAKALPTLLNLARYFNEVSPWMWSPRTEIKVLTNGVFDLPHPGHAKIFDYMRKRYGGFAKLVVAVNTDESATDFKRAPIMPYEWRVTMVQALLPEATVIPLETSVEDIVKNGGYHLYVKGGDYNIYDLRRKMWRYGMGVNICPRNDTYSTSFLLDRLRSTL